MNTTKLENYKSFFADQVKEEIIEQQTVNKSLMRDLFKEGKLSLAFVDSIQHETGMVILKCPRRMSPQLKVQKSIVIIKKGARQELGDHPTEWTCTWEDFAKNADFHSPGSDVTPMYFVHAKDSSYDYVACTGISTRLYDIFAKSIADGKSLSVIIHDPFPPVDYFRNLSIYIDLYPSNEELDIEPKLSYEDWKPEELAFDYNNPDNISNTILKTLEDDTCCIVQGPPGTGNR